MKESPQDPAADREVEPNSQIPKAWPFKRVFYGWAIVWTGFVASFGMVPMFGPVLGVFFEPIQEELGWSRATMAFAFTLGSMTSSLATFAFGRVLDKYGARAIVVIAGVIITLAMLGISFMQEPWQFWILFGLGRGSALGGIQIGVGISIANWFVRRRPRAVAIRQSGLRAGQAIFPMLIVAILAVTGWREAWRILAVLTGLLIIIPGAIFLRRRPEDLGLYPDGEKPADASAAAPRGFGRDIRDISWTLKEARRTRAFWMIVMFVSVDRFALGAINLHMVISFQDKGLSAVQAVSILSLFAATSALTGVPWGFVFEKLHIRFGAMLISFLLLLSMGVLIIADTYPMAILFGLVFGFAVGGSSLVETLLWSDFFGRRHMGEIRAFTAPFRLLSPVGPTAAGYIFDTTGSYRIAYSIFGGVFFVMLLAMSFATVPVKPEAVVADVEETPAGS
ncbi:MAG: MFS transporter [Chloroflexi bacterium]|nr:MFS transporter [Chloroflexota bacterium]